jgi:hypothetical protein
MMETRFSAIFEGKITEITLDGDGLYTVTVQPDARPYGSLNWRMIVDLPLVEYRPREGDAVAVEWSSTGDPAKTESRIKIKSAPWIPARSWRLEEWIG